MIVPRGITPGTTAVAPSPSKSPWPSPATNRTRSNAFERAPRSNVVPAEVSGEHHHPLAALQNTHVDRNRRHRAKKSLDVLRVRMERPGDFRRQPAHIVEKISDAPYEDSGVPEVA